jgi:hypothetical protein
MKCSNNIEDGNGVKDIFAYNSIALRIADRQIIDLRMQNYMYLKPVGIKGTYGAFEVRAGGYIPLINPTHTMRGSVPLSIQPQFSQVPSWAQPRSKT